MATRKASRMPSSSPEDVWKMLMQTAQARLGQMIESMLSEADDTIRERLEEEITKIRPKLDESVKKVLTELVQSGLRGERGPVGPRGPMGSVGRQGPESKVPGPAGKNGKHGRDGVPGMPAREAVIEYGAIAEHTAEHLIQTKKLRPEHIDGLGELMQSFWKRMHATSKSGILRGGGDIVLAGTGITIARDSVGRSTISVAGTGFTTLVATETPNSGRTVFTFAAATAQPTFIVSDNVWMRATTKSGTVNWTWNNGTKQTTMTVAPQDEIYGIV